MDLFEYEAKELFAKHGITSSASASHRGEQSLERFDRVCVDI